MDIPEKDRQDRQQEEADNIREISITKKHRKGKTSWKKASLKSEKKSTASTRCHDDIDDEGEFDNDDYQMKNDEDGCPKNSESKPRDDENDDDFASIGDNKNDNLIGGADGVGALVSSRKQVKSRKGKELIKKRDEGELFEDVKKCLIIKGTKCNLLVQNALCDIRDMKKPYSKMMDIFNKRRRKSIDDGKEKDFDVNVDVFENPKPIESLLYHNAASLFVYGSTSKKRPHRLIFGRLFNHHVLDLYEFNIIRQRLVCEFSQERKKRKDKEVSQKPIMLRRECGVEESEKSASMRVGDEEELGVETSNKLRLFLPRVDSKALILLQGSSFLQNETYMQIRNFFGDFFRGTCRTPSKSMILLAGIEKIISISGVELQAHEDAKQFLEASINDGDNVISTRNTKGSFADSIMICIRQYRCLLRKGEDNSPRVVLEEIGPSLDLKLDRFRLPYPDSWKNATKYKEKKRASESSFLEAKKRKSRKRIHKTAVGDVVSRVFVDTPDWKKISRQQNPVIHKLAKQERRKKFIED